MRLLATVSVIAAATSAASSAAGCEVMPYEMAAKEADIVFIGRATEGSAPMDMGDPKPENYTFKVTRSLKGDVPSSIVIRDTGNNCYGFPQFDGGAKKATDYLVFAKLSAGRYITFHPMPNVPTDWRDVGSFLKTWDTRK